MKMKRFRPVLSLLLCAAMLCAMAVPGWSAASAAGATYEKRNLIVDPGFDLPNGFVTDNAVDRWNSWDVSKSNDGRSGSCVKFSARESSLQYNIDGSTLQAGVTYEFSIWAKVESGDDILDIGAKQYNADNGGQTVKAAGNAWKQYTVEFTYTTGNPILYVYNNIWVNGSTAVAYVDDASLTVKGDVEQVSITNGSITVSGKDLDLNAFTAVYTTSLNPSESKTLALTAGNGALAFTPIPGAAVAQTVNVVLTYKGQNISLSFPVAVDDTIPVVAAKIAGLSVTNGTAVITLAEKPTVAPTVDDIVFTLTVNGAPASFRRSSFTYDGEKTVTVGFEPVSASLSGERAVSLTVACGGESRTGSFTLAQGTSRVYYVAEDGSDANDGLTPETAIQSIDKLNTLTFVPGDRILFKSGDTFTGMFRPRGSGNANAPIMVGKYGGDARPVLQPDPNGIFDYALGAGTVATRKVNGTIWLENVEYWEIRDLELHDPSYDPNFYKTGTLEVYNAGLRVVNVDQGDLSHFVFDNLKIHGFRGPGINPGKTSGGIQFNVGTRAATPVPSCFVDVSITNCEIYQCGRDGINSLSVWGYRRYQDNGSSWPSFPSAEYNRAYSYYPSRNLYVADNILREIDGDGLIVDSWDNAIVEHNLATRCAIHLSDPFRAAVGLFNWNSDNTVFQYNECSFNGVDATRHTISSDRVEEHVTVQDGQGIEVDALNQNTWVQYNYLHDNAAFMMLCTESAQYTSINTYIRYNVTENDGCNLPNTPGGMSWFLNGNCGINTQVYNNTCILGQNALKNGQLYLLKYNSAQYKFYNNIFYYKGADTPVAAISWQDGGDYQGNLLINISNKPTDDNADHPNVSISKAEGEALFVGGTGAEAYRLAKDTYEGTGAVLPSMSDGMFSDRDMAGTAIPATPGVGAFVYVD